MKLPAKLRTKVGRCSWGVAAVLIGCAISDPANTGSAGTPPWSRVERTSALRNEKPQTQPEKTQPAEAPEQKLEGSSPSLARTADEPLLSRGELFAHWNALRGDPYELDAIERHLEEPSGKRIACSQEGLVDYSGTALRYAGPVKVNPAFKERLVLFEQVVAEVAEQVYGRKPRRIRHYGAYSCRKSRNRTYRISEHALGNAIDVLGFDFGPATKDAPLRPDLPKQLKSSFQVRVLKHWAGTGNAAAQIHSRFLRELTSRLVERRDIFRILIGPSHRGHADHFHFDVSPWRYVHL